MDAPPTRPETTSNEQPEILTQREVAGILRVTLRTVQRMTVSGILPHFVLGRLVRYRRADVMEATRKFSA